VSDQPSANDLQQKYQQLLELLPLAAHLAGLPPSEGRLFTEEQVDGRAITFRLALKVARALVDEITGGDPQKFRQFRDLQAMTVSLSGLPVSSARLFGEEQIEARAITVKAAYRVARATARECLGGS
jgi:hypothetical protein